MVRKATIMVTMNDLAGGWGQARAALQQQLDMLEADPVDPQFGLNEHERNTIVLHLKKAISAYDALMKEYSNAQRA